MKIINKTIYAIMILLFCAITAYLTATYSWLGLFVAIATVVGGLLLVLIIKNPFLGLLGVVATLPFERIPTIDLGPITLKPDQVFAGLAIISFLLNIIFNKEKFKKYSIGWIVAIFVFLTLISVCFAVDTSRAVSVFIFIVFMIIVSFITTNLVDRENRLTQLIKVLFIVTVFITLFGLYQFLGDVAGLPAGLTGLKEAYSKIVLGFPRVQAFSMEPLYFANFLFIPLGIATSMYLSGKNRIISNKNLLILIILILINIILGISRGAYVALAFFVLLFMVFYAKKVFTIRNILVTLFGVLLLGSFSYGFLSVSNPDALDKFISHAKVEDYSNGESVQKRLRDFDRAISYWQESPIIGIGPGNYGARYLDYPDHDVVTNWEIVNNEYLELLVEHGILGLLLYIILILVIFARSIKAYIKSKDDLIRALILGLNVALAAILVQYNFFSTLYIMHIWFLIGLIVAMQNLAFKEQG